MATTVDHDAKARDVNVRVEARAKAHAKHTMGQARAKMIELSRKWFLMTANSLQPKRYRTRFPQLCMVVLHPKLRV